MAKKMKSAIIILTAVACILAGVAGGFGLSYVKYQPRLARYATLASNLQSEVASLNQSLSSRETRITNLEKEKTALEQKRSELEADKARLKTDFNQVWEALSIYKNTVNSLEQEKIYLRDQLDTTESENSELVTELRKILTIKVSQSYGWYYAGENWEWDLVIPLSLYVKYREMPRAKSVPDYVAMAKEPGSFPYIDRLVQQIKSLSAQENFTDAQKVNFVISFVQNLPYTVDIETTPYDEYPRYPVETLFDRGGDCEDTSVLTAALLYNMGYNVALLHLENARHIAVGVAITYTAGSYYEYNGKKYFYLETTGKGWQIGRIPPSITDTKAHVYPL